MADRSIGKATLANGVEVEAFLNDIERTMSWTVFKDGSPKKHCPESGRWPSPQRSENQTAATLLVLGLNWYISFPQEVE